MTDEESDAAFQAVVDSAKLKANAAFDAAAATGAWDKWREADPTSAPWWEAGMEWVWTVLKEGGFLESLVPATYRPEAKHAIRTIALGFFDEELRPHQDRAFGPYAPDMRDTFATYLLTRLLPRVTACVLGPSPAKSVKPEGVPGRDREALVNEFIHRCNDELPFKVLKKHIPAAAKHQTERQFQYWQKGDARATAKDDENFRRILAMSPKDFHALLLQLRVDGVPTANVR
jgi:hypothetical protein